jgi:hypothetical protein
MVIEIKVFLAIMEFVEIGLKATAFSKLSLLHEKRDDKTLRQAHVTLRIDN